MTPIDPFGLAGQVLDGQFRVDRFVGEGGFGVVYRGTHVGLLGEPIAVKCLKLPNTLGSALVESFVKRFRDESRLHYKLSQGHLHIARSIASGTTLAPATSALVPYTVLEWLEGKSLAEDLDARRAQGLGGRSLRETVKLLDSAIDALAYAHAQGVVHRDLNPGNLFLAETRAGIKLKVLDFGVAKIMADSWLAAGQSAQTMGNLRIFTPAFAAPEQFDDRVGAVGPWTDVYAVALVTLEVLTGRSVMDGEHLGELAARALDPKGRPTPRRLGLQVGEEVEDAFARAVAVQPSERPRDVGEFWGTLKHAISSDAESGEPRADPRPHSTPPPRTVRMPDAPEQGLRAPVGPAREAGTAAGQTLRMAEARCPAQAIQRPFVPGEGLARPADGGATSVEWPASPGSPTEFDFPPLPEAVRLDPLARGPVIVFVGLATLAAVVVAAAWLLH